MLGEQQHPSGTAKSGEEVRHAAVAAGRLEIVSPVSDGARTELALVNPL